MVQPSGRSGLGGMGAGLKRRFQLMINDAPRSSKVWLEDVVNHLVYLCFIWCECAPSFCFTLETRFCPISVIETIQ